MTGDCHLPRFFEKIPRENHIELGERTFGQAAQSPATKSAPNYPLLTGYCGVSQAGLINPCENLEAFAMAQRRLSPLRQSVFAVSLARRQSPWAMPSLSPAAC
jgi:hypothetical protein